jgi:hypothetical protein
MKYFFLLCSIMILGCSRSRSAACDAYSSEPTKESNNDIDRAVIADTVIQISELRIARTPALKKKVEADFEEPREVNRSEDELAQEQQIKVSLQHLSELNESVSIQRDQRTPVKLYQDQIDQELYRLQQLSPNSFEYHLNKYIAGKYDLALSAHLQQATQLDPENPKLTNLWVAHASISGDEKLAAKYLSDWFSVQPDSQCIVTYARDLLNSVDDNGTLIVHAIQDTYSVLYVQFNLGIRRDVRVISLEWLQSQTYRDNVKSSAYLMPEEKVIGPEFLMRFCELNSSKNIALSMTIPREYVQKLSSSLFVVGLTLVHTNEENFENFYRNEQLWDEKWDKEFLLSAQNSFCSRKDILSNYLPMLLQLRSACFDQGMVQQLEELDIQIQSVAQAAGKKEWIDQLNKNQK